MIECMIIGDSIAVGVSQHRQECVNFSKVGITSHSWNKRYLNKLHPAKTTIISLGSNDFKADITFENLLKLRESMDTVSVFWIVPAIKPEMQEIIELIADRYNDNVLYIRETADKVHPTTKEYKRLAKETK